MFDAMCDLTIRPQNLCDIQMEKCDSLIGSTDAKAVAAAVKQTRTRFGGHADVQIALTSLRVYEAKLLAKSAAAGGGGGAAAAPKLLGDFAGKAGSPTKAPPAAVTPRTAVIGAGRADGARVAAELLIGGHEVSVYDAAGLAYTKEAVAAALGDARFITASDAAAALKRLSAKASIGECVADAALVCEW